jgi:NADPH-dependent 7-cyano-7-deazaguanine reductase QueF
VFQHGSYDPTDDIAQAVSQCKKLARDLKRQRPSRSRLPTGVYQSFPDRQVMDELVRLYFIMFESCCRIVYQPSFITEYKSFIEQPESVESAFLLQLSL